MVPKGCAVHLMYVAANRDPARFANQNQFDPEPTDKRALRLRERETHVHGWSTCSPGSQHRAGNFFAHCRKPAADCRPAAVSAEPDIPRPSPRADRLRQHSRPNTGQTALVTPT